MDLFPDLLESGLAGGHSSPVQLFEKFAPAQSGKLGGLPLRDDALGVPLDSRCDAHFPGELIRIFPKRGQ